MSNPEQILQGSEMKELNNGPTDNLTPHTDFEEEDTLINHKKGADLEGGKIKQALLSFTEYFWKRS